MRDSFIFYKSWTDAIEMLPKSQQLEMYKSITNYALKDIEPELSGTTKLIYELVKPLLDTNNKRHQNGCTGGRPKDLDSPRKELNGIELTNLTETQYAKLCARFGEAITDKAIEIFEGWLARGSKNAREFIGKNHYAHFKADHWTIKQAEEITKGNQPNWSV